MEERSEVEKMEEIMLPGFRFHPTDEELVGFYLKRKIQQRPLSIELIKQLDIYKYDPWDLPKLAMTGEKEWYFYCPRDRKYRNSTRPNRVTGAGFWKATGTDRPIYSSEGNKCIGLKKSLVFYKGRAAKGIKTDWMMHEFRLPSITDPSSKRFMDKTTIPPNDSWAICRIFKKTNSTAQRALSQSWVSPLVTEPLISSSSSVFTKPTQLGSLPTEYSTACMQFNNNYFNCSQQSPTCPDTDFSSQDFSSYKVLNPFLSTKLHPQHLPIPNTDLNGNCFFSPLETLAPSRCTVDVSSMLLNMSSSMLGPNESSIDFGSGLPENYNNGFLLNSILPQIMNGDNCGGEENMTPKHFDGQWNGIRSVAIPISLPANIEDGRNWKPNLAWDSSSPSQTDQMSSSAFSTTQCYT